MRAGGAPAVPGRVGVMSAYDWGVTVATLAVLTFLMWVTP